MVQPLRIPKETYHDRDSLITALGYADYQDYLRSAEWKKIRAVVLRRYRYKCALCSSKAKAVHHITYSRAVLLGEDKAGLVPVCKQHHLIIEFDDDREKRSLQEAKKTYARIRMAKCIGCGVPTGSKRYLRCNACYKKFMR